MHRSEVSTKMSKTLQRPKYKSSIFNKLPINLLRKVVRERRNRNERLLKRPQRKIRKRKPDFARSEHDALVRATESQLETILANDDVLSDIPYDYTPEELLGEIALAKGEGTTVYVQRDGLSTLTVVLPQPPEPTIANLKRAIEASARAQLKRETRERHEERLRRRQRSDEAVVQQSNSNAQRLDGMILEPPRSSGELVYSTARNGHQHRSNVSWRFLWRAFALFSVNTNSPLDDSNGRKLLSACGVENASTLKFCKREAYFGRKRQ